MAVTTDEHTSMSEAVTPPTSEPARAAQRVVEVLQANDVRYVIGIPGAKIDAVFDALADGGPGLIVCRHEQNAPQNASLLE